MKFNYDKKNKKANFEADIEKIVEKGMDQHEHNWKDKFKTRHDAKKEMLKIKHNQKMETEEQKQNKKSWFQQIQEEKRKMKELEIEEARRIRELEIAEEKRKEEERKKIIKIKIVISIILAVIGIIMFSIGSLKGDESGDPNSAWHAIACVGLFPIFVAVGMWGIDAGSNEKKSKKKK